MNPKILGIIGGGVLIVGVIAFALWQANGLVKLGEEKARLETENEELREQLTVKAEEVETKIDELTRRMETECIAKVKTATDVGDRWRERYEELSGRGPVIREVPVEIESTTCTGALYEGLAQVAEPIRAYLEASRAEIPP